VGKARLFARDDQAASASATPLPATVGPGDDLAALNPFERLLGEREADSWAAPQHAPSGLIFGPLAVWDGSSSAMPRPFGEVSLHDALASRLPQAGPVTILPSPGAPGIAANTPATIVATGDFTIAAGDVRFANALAVGGFELAGFYGRFLVFDGATTSTFTNNGTLWNRITNATADGNQNIGLYTLGLAANNGKIVIELNAGLAYGVVVNGDSITSGAANGLTNAGQIFALTDLGSAFGVLNENFVHPVVNSGLIAAHAGTGIAEAVDIRNGGNVVNQAGGAIIAEGVDATAVYLGRGIFVMDDTAPALSNAGLIEAVSLNPDNASVGVLAAHLDFEAMNIVNSGTIDADYAIYATADATSSQKGTETVTNQAGGQINGVIFLGLGDDHVVNQGTINGIVAMDEGNDSVDNSAGVINGYTDLGFGDDSYIGSGQDEDVLGGRGDDVISGGGGQDLLLGGYGNDTLTGGAGGDGLYGEYGDDRIVAGKGDFVSGGAGNDRIELTDFGGFAGIRGGSGFDTLVLPGAARIVDLGVASDGGAITGIDDIQLGGGLGLAIRPADVAAVSDANEIVVQGDASNTVYLVGGWSETGQSVVGGVTYRVFTAGGSELLVQPGIVATVQAGAPPGAAGFDPAPGVAPPTPNPDFLATDVTNVNGYWLNYSLTIFANETWQSDNGAPVIATDSGGVTGNADFSAGVTNYGAIKSVMTDPVIPGESDFVRTAYGMFVVYLSSLENHGLISATGVGNGPADSVFIGSFGKTDNFGTIEAIARQGDATGVFTYDSSQMMTAPAILNNGTIHAHSDGGQALGVRMANRAAFVNNGTIVVEGENGAVAFQGEGGMQIVNTGAITATALAGGLPSIAFHVYASDYISIANSGTVTADSILQSGDPVELLAGRIDVQNSGTMHGLFQFVEGWDQVMNTGTIVGDIHLAGGNDTYDGTGGHLVGKVYGENGNDTLTGGDGDDTFVGGAGDDTINGGAGNDTAIFAGNASDYTVTHDGAVTTVSGPDGTDTLTSIENIVFIPVHAAPVITGAGHVDEYLEQAAPMVVESALVVSDADSANLTGATVAISANFAPGDMLGFAGQNGISGSYNPNTHILTLSGTASVAAYQAALRAVTFSSDSDNPGPFDRTISFVTTDGTLSSTPVTDQIFVREVDDPPVFSGLGTVGYLEQSSGVVVGGGLVISDVDSSSIATIRVTISSGYVAGDKLSLVSPNYITGTWDAASHTLTMDWSTVIADFQVALRAITFSSPSDNPTNFGASPTRTLTWSVDQGFSDAMTTTSTIIVTAIDDPPSLHNDAFATNEQIAIGEGFSLFANNGQGVDSDIDGPALHVTAVNGVVGNVGHQITLASGALVTVNANGTFSYDPNGAFAALAAPGSGSSDTSATDSFSYTVNGSVETATVTITGVDSNDTLHGTSANNVFDGGIGTDTLVLTGNHADYTIGYDSAAAAYTVIDNRAGHPDGTDTVRNVELFKFADGTVSVATVVQTVHNPDGSTAITTYDAGNDTPWASQIATTDTQGSLATQTVVTDGGTKWVNSFDTTGTQTWTTMSASYDAANHQLTQLVNNDDGTHALTLNDVANIYRWASATISYDANWNVTGVTGTNDDASHTITMKDIQIALDGALWSPSSYDPNQGLPNAITLTGGGNADYLSGGAGNDTLSGLGGNDVLSGGAGNDTLTGGAGNDRFVFHNGDGLDVITDFTAGDASGDLIELHAYGIANFAALAPFMSQSGVDVVIAFDPDNTITLQHVTLTQLNAGDFAFG
jgi:hypothetical protein